MVSRSRMGVLGVERRVLDVHDAPVEDRPSRRRARGRCGSGYSLLQRVDARSASTPSHGREPELSGLEPGTRRCRLASHSRARVLHDRVEDRLHVGRRAGDHAQDLAGRRLLLEGLGEVGVLGLQLGEQPRVLDGDGRLVGEGLHQGDLAVGERPDLVPVDEMTPSSSSALSMGTASTVRIGSTCTQPVACTRGRPGRRECGWCAARGRRAPTALSRPGAMGFRSRKAPRLGGDVAERPPRAAPDRRSGRSRDRSASHSRTAFSASVSKTGWRSKVDRPITLSSSLVAVCCSSATRSSLLRASSSVNRRTFSMAMTAWSAKVLSRSICLAENGPGSARATAIAPMGAPSRSMGTTRMLR